MFIILKNKLSIKDQIYFTKRLSFLIKAGIPLLDSLKIIQSNMKSQIQNIFFERLINYISNGKSLSNSLAHSNFTFNLFILNIINIGETVGTLDQCLSYVSHELNKRYQIQKKIIAALLYPACIVVVTLVIIVVLGFFIFPKIEPIFRDLKVTIPFTTKLLILIGITIRRYGIIILAIICALFITTYIKYQNNNNFKKKIDYILLKLPFIGNLIRAHFISYFCRNLSLLLKSSVHISEALRITGEASQNSLYKTEFIKLSQHINQGGGISEYVQKKQNLFPSPIPELIDVGEKTGNLPDTFMYLSELHEQEAENALQLVSQLFEPLLMIILGCIVAFISVSIISPIYEITQNLHP